MDFCVQGMCENILFIINDNDVDEFDKLAAIEQYIEECIQLTKKGE